MKPTPPDWKWLDALIGQVDADFAQATEEQPSDQERPELDFFND